MLPVPAAVPAVAPVDGLHPPADDRLGDLLHPLDSPRRDDEPRMVILAAERLVGVEEDLLLAVVSARCHEDPLLVGEPHLLPDALGPLGYVVVFEVARHADAVGGNTELPKCSGA